MNITVKRGEAINIMTKINKITVTGKNNVPKIITNGIENI
jgi:hypothetical protein